MTSNFLERIGMGGVDPGILILILFFLLLILLIIVIVNAISLGNLRRRYESFMKGRGGRSLESEIRNLFYDIDYLKDGAEEHNRAIRHIYKRLEGVYQRIGLVKYDAFHQMGGKLSFALALLDENDNGFLLNSVHSSDGGYCYAKEIRGGSCEIELSVDEQKALDIALSQPLASLPAKEKKKDTKRADDGKEEREERSRRSKAQSDEHRSQRKESSDEYEEEYEDYTESEAAGDLYEDEEYEAGYEDDYEDPDLAEAEQLIDSLSGSPRHRVIAEDDGEEGVLTYTTGNRRRR